MSYYLASSKTYIRYFIRGVPFSEEVDFLLKNFASILPAGTFFQLLVNDDTKVNKTQRIYNKAHLEVDSLSEF